MAEKFDREKFLKKFWEFCASVTISTKELGRIRLNKENLLGTQVYFIEELAKGLEEGIHEFYVLKGRQVAITTICLVLDIFWLGRHKGLTGAFVTHDESTRDMFRITFTQIADSTRPPMKVSFKVNNRTQLVTKANNNRMVYMVAGTGQNSKLGKGSAITFAHMTEESAYGDEEGLASLAATFAENNPDRLFIHETTAQGYNHFHVSWGLAKQSNTARAIFVGWWRNGFYRKAKGSKEHTVYWDGKLLPDERKWVKEIKQIYDYDIDDEQIAWWRWNLAEKTKDEFLMYQNFPPTEHYAFVKSGSLFFSGARINEEYKLAIKTKPAMYRFVLKEGFEDTELIESSERMCNMKVWEKPMPGAFYAIGADPAYGSSEWKDRFVAQVYRCYSDGMDQVAEFCTADCSPYQFAWVVCYLGGAYLSPSNNRVMLNLELNGPGQSVWREMLNLKRLSIMSQTEVGKKIFSVVSNLENFMYKRADSFGAPTAFHTISTTKEKERMLIAFRDNFERGIIKVHSKDLIDEMRSVERDGAFIGAPDRQKDDRVIGSSLATTAWTDFLVTRLIIARPGGLTREISKKMDNGESNASSVNVAKFLSERMKA